MKLIITGMSRHGKDTACNYLREIFGLESISSSFMAGHVVVYPVLKEKYNYADFEECYKDRHNHQQEWFELIKEYNNPDLTKLARAIFSKFPIYNGIRNIEELNAIKEQLQPDLIIWIDATERVEEEEASSCSVTKEDCDIIITNNGTETEFKKKLWNLFKKYDLN